jgi:hypothetical protein
MNDPLGKKSPGATAEREAFGPLTMALDESKEPSGIS